jgi:guanidinopropionase
LVEETLSQEAPHQDTHTQLASAAAVYQHWAGIATFLRCPHRPDLSDTEIGLIGFPHAGGNMIERMQYLGPRAVRNRSSAYRRAHRKFQIDPFASCRVSDLGDVPLVSGLNPDLVAKEAEEFYRRLDELRIIPITIGGDHSITTPILRGIAGTKSRHGGPIGMIHFDSHPDSFPPAMGTAHHAGVAFRVGAEEGLIDPARTVQIGFHGSVGSLVIEDWSREHFTVIDLETFIERGPDRIAEDIRRIIGDGPTYLSFDVDVLDLAFAPAVADPEVDGMTTRELFALLNKLRGINLVGADIVCFCPPLDTPAQTTALTISELMFHLVSHIADYRRGVPAAR